MRRWWRRWPGVTIFHHEPHARALVVRHRCPGPGCLGQAGAPAGGGPGCGSVSLHCSVDHCGSSRRGELLQRLRPTGLSPPRRPPPLTPASARARPSRASHQQPHKLVITAGAGCAAVVVPAEVLALAALARHAELVVCATDRQRCGSSSGERSQCAHAPRGGTVTRCRCPILVTPSPPTAPAYSETRCAAPLRHTRLTSSAKMRSRRRCGRRSRPTRCRQRPSSRARLRESDGAATVNTSSIPCTHVTAPPYLRTPTPQPSRTRSSCRAQRPCASGAGAHLSLQGTSVHR